MHIMSVVRERLYGRNVLIALVKDTSLVTVEIGVLTKYLLAMVTVRIANIA